MAPCGDSDPVVVLPQQCTVLRVALAVALPTFSSKVSLSLFLSFFFFSFSASLRRVLVCLSFIHIRITSLKKIQAGRVFSLQRAEEGKKGKGNRTSRALKRTGEEEEKIQNPKKSQIERKLNKGKQTTPSPPEMALLCGDRRTKKTKKRNERRARVCVCVCLCGVIG